MGFITSHVQKTFAECTLMTAQKIEIHKTSCMSVTTNSGNCYDLIPALNSLLLLSSCASSTVSPSELQLCTTSAIFIYNTNYESDKTRDTSNTLCHEPHVENSHSM